MRKLLGLFITMLPIIAILTFIGYAIGVAFVAVVIGLTAISLACVRFGFSLMEDSN